MCVCIYLIILFLILFDEWFFFFVYVWSVQYDVLHYKAVRRFFIPLLAFWISCVFFSQPWEKPMDKEKKLHEFTCRARFVWKLKWTRDATIVCSDFFSDFTFVINLLVDFSTKKIIIWYLALHSCTNTVVIS